MIVLGIETSCDETGAALCVDGVVVADRTTTQTLHEAFGGVVPELASRAHEQLLTRAVKSVLNEADITAKDVDAVAVTAGPGLVGALLVGASFAKGFALAGGMKAIAVNHLEAHLWSAEAEGRLMPTPFLALVISGGHTILVQVNGLGDYAVLGETHDDAAGEILDKVGRMIGFGFPAGATIDAAAVRCELEPVRLPVPRVSGDPLGFSFSGLKTAALYHLQTTASRVNGVYQLAEEHRERLCAGLMRSVGAALSASLSEALTAHPTALVAVAGGVAASRFILPMLTDAAGAAGADLIRPSPKLCTDNAAMIARLGWKNLTEGVHSPLEFAINPSAGLTQIRFT